MDDCPVAEPRWRELTKSECFELLSRQNLGRLAFVDDLGPVVVPVNYLLNRHMVVIRTDEGTKLDAATRGAKVAFEIDGADEAGQSGWSVLVRGEAAAVTDPAELERLRDLPVSPIAPGRKSNYIRVMPALVTGRRILAPTDHEVGRWERT